MELAFLTPLLKDGADCVGGGVTIDDEGIFEARLMKDWGGANSVDKGLEGGLMFVVPMEAAALRTVGNQHIEWGREHAEILNVHAVEIEETEKSMQLPERGGSFPIFNAVNFNGVHGDVVLTDDNTKIFDFCDFELAFLWFEVEVVVSENMEDVIDNSLM